MASQILGPEGLIGAAGAWPRGLAAWLLGALQLAVFTHFFSLIWARLRPGWWRCLVSLPALFFAGGSFIALPWALAHAVTLSLPWPWLPYAVALAGVAEGLFTRETVVDLVLDGEAIATEWPRPHRPPPARSSRPLRIVQITDPHLGPWMSERRLRRICARAVAREPDLVLLTGDFLTMESNGSPEALASALAPLQPLAGRTFACRGNHDLEAPATVSRALSEAGVQLLIDEAVRVQTAAGPVQILGIDFRFRDRAEHHTRVCREHPRDPQALRVVLLHDPGAFRHLPAGEADLVLSGHTHGGQVGLVSLGLSWTFLRLVSKMPDHGLWARGSDRLYVHRGTGHYGFPLRLGVPAEQSLLRVHDATRENRS
jgi:predicted MPP superfamily phosphohydrolase